MVVTYDFRLSCDSLDSSFSPSLGAWARVWSFMAAPRSSVSMNPVGGAFWRVSAPGCPADSLDVDVKVGVDFMLVKDGENAFVGMVLRNVAVDTASIIWME